MMSPPAYLHGICNRVWWHGGEFPSFWPFSDFPQNFAQNLHTFFLGVRSGVFVFLWLKLALPSRTSQQEILTILPNKHMDFESKLYNNRKMKKKHTLYAYSLVST